MSDYDKRLDAAGKHLSANVLKMISQILQRHDAAIIEASMDAIDAAVLAEREACARLCETHAGVGANDPRFMLQGVLAAAIRARGQE